MHENEAGEISFRARDRVKDRAYGAIGLPPTLRKKREGWGTHFVIVPSKGWGARPTEVRRRAVRTRVKCVKLISMGP